MAIYNIIYCFIIGIAHEKSKALNKGTEHGPRSKQQAAVFEVEANQKQNKKGVKTKTKEVEKLGPVDSITDLRGKKKSLKKRGERQEEKQD